MWPTSWNMLLARCRRPGNPADEEHNAAWSGLGTPHDRLKKAKARIDLELGLPHSRCGPELNLPCQFA
jgi:hypothetical protein